jgi:hypothetical protein
VKTEATPAPSAPRCWRARRRAAAGSGPSERSRHFPMATIVGNCPRCGVRHTTFDVPGVNFVGQQPHVPKDIADVFVEAATCLSVECWNAAGAMFRLCVDLTTKPMLPTGETPGLNNKIRRDLGLRLSWLFDNNKLPSDLRELSACIHQDGNDAAHTGKLTKIDAEDLLDFTRELLERVYTEPARLKLAAERRANRRKPS